MNGNENIKFHKYAINELLIALEIATNNHNNQRYKFMMYNISIAFWKIIHQFIRSNRAKFFINEMKLITTALDNIIEYDKKWYILYNTALSFCYYDNNNKNDSIIYIDKSIEQMNNILQITIIKEEKLNKELIDINIEKDTIMIAYHQIEEHEFLKNKPKKIDPDAPPEPRPDPDHPVVHPDPVDLPVLTGLALKGYEYVNNLLIKIKIKKSDLDKQLRNIIEIKNKEIEKLLSLYQQRITINPTDGKRVLTLPQVCNYGFLLSFFCLLIWFFYYVYYKLYTMFMF